MGWEARAGKSPKWQKRWVKNFSRPAEKFYGPPQEPVVLPEKIRRNDPCPCESGKKWKRCHGG